MMYEEDAQNSGVFRFLQQLGLEKHWDIFKAKGYDRETDLLELSSADMDYMNITGHESTNILHAVRHFRLSPSFRLQCWLEQQGLGHYYDNLRRCDVTDMDQLGHLTLDSSVYNDLEMDVPGHRKRFAKAVVQLRKRRRLMEAEEAICQGYWGKPEALVSAKNDFLCLTAKLQSTRDRAKCVSLEFMVDSGSDVVTVRQETLDDLDLELIGTCHSQGVHASKKKKLYRGIIIIGGIEVETEVMSETYECVGNQVLRNFRHYIDANHHFWMRSDHRFLPPGDLPPSLQPSALHDLGSGVTAAIDCTDQGEGHVKDKGSERCDVEEQDGPS